VTCCRCAVLYVIMSYCDYVYCVYFDVLCLDVIMFSLSRTKLRNNSYRFGRVQQQGANRIGTLVCLKGTSAIGALLGSPQSTSLCGPDAWRPTIRQGRQ
jgi:hypothetical protein